MNLFYWNSQKEDCLKVFIQQIFSCNDAHGAFSLHIVHITKHTHAHTHIGLYGKFSDHFNKLDKQCNMEK